MFGLVVRSVVLSVEITATPAELDTKARVEGGPAMVTRLRMQTAKSKMLGN
jgi:hypothetical protein